MLHEATVADSVDGKGHQSSKKALLSDLDRADGALLSALDSFEAMLNTLACEISGSPTDSAKEARELLSSLDTAEASLLTVVAALHRARDRG